MPLLRSIHPYEKKNERKIRAAAVDFFFHFAISIRIHHIDAGCVYYDSVIIML